MAVPACATLNSISSKISNLGFYRCIPSSTTENTVFRMHLTTHFLKGGRSWFKALIVSLIPVSPPPDNLFATSSLCSKSDFVVFNKSSFCTKYDKSACFTIARDCLGDVIANSKAFAYLSTWNVVKSSSKTCMWQKNISFLLRWDYVHQTSSIN